MRTRLIARLDFFQTLVEKPEATDADRVVLRALEAKAFSWLTERWEPANIADGYDAKESDGWHEPGPLATALIIEFRDAVESLVGGRYPWALQAWDVAVNANGDAWINGYEAKLRQVFGEPEGL